MNMTGYGLVPEIPPVGAHVVRVSNGIICARAWFQTDGRLGSWTDEDEGHEWGCDPLYTNLDALLASQ